MKIHSQLLTNLYVELYANSGNVPEFNKILLKIRAERDRIINR